MNKEWLEFFGGLFVFLAALVPVIRATWRSLRRKLTVETLAFILLSAANFCISLCGIIGLLQHWNPNIVIGLFVFYILGQTVGFSIYDFPITRKEIGVYVLGVVMAASIIGAQLARLP